ncbi:phosphate ABC transporter substrate-binding protein PstS [Pseudonocardiaceae bacterium YIM PH 21723]|nr:phosphate ABC transporter substrate-binding protein PstS [Pseudonocardiaceae bacterium YIM PH 21723]
MKRLGAPDSEVDEFRGRREPETRQLRDFRSRGAASVLGALLAVILLALGQPALAADFFPISGAGSTWSSNAIDQWRKNVAQYGMKINYSANGSSDGRNQFKAGTVDFGVSEIPYGLTDGGVTDFPPTRGFAYMPIVAGGTSFMYNLSIGGKRITNLRLAGDTVTKIFTGAITNWNDPAIKADNPQLSLPARKIVPVVRSDGSGTTAQFTTYMANQYPDLWNAYCAKVGRSTPCGFTSIYPPSPGMVPQAQSVGVSGYVSQEGNDGTITYVEYSYALNKGFPVAKLLNKAGYYVEPTASNVAVALLSAQIKPDLTQELGGVYNNGDNRTYPMSSYSYMIVPTKLEGNFSESKGYTLGEFAYYFLCEGQQQADPLGYSPLPINLVRAGLDQVQRIPGSQKKSTDISKCNNPTFSADGSNTLAAKAPQPPACDKKGVSQCATGTGGAKSSSTALTGGGSTGDGSAGGGDAATDGSTGDAPGGGIDPDTGLPSGTARSNSTNAAAVPVSLSLQNSTWQYVLIGLAVALLIGLLVGPPLVHRYLAARRAS